MQFLRPDLYLAVLDPANADFKPTALRYLDRADALLLASPLSAGTAWQKVAPSLLRDVPRFAIAAPEYMTDEVAEFVCQRLAAEPT